MKEYKGDYYEEIKITIKLENGDIVAFIDPKKWSYDVETKTLKVLLGDGTKQEHKNVIPKIHYRNSYFFS